MWNLEQTEQLVLRSRLWIVVIAALLLAAINFAVSPQKLSRFFSAEQQPSSLARY